MCSIVEVIDDSNNVHKYNQSAKPLGEGGQGIVYRSLNPDLAIKIERQNGVETTDKQQIEDFHKKIRNIRLLQLEDDIKISLPLTNINYIIESINKKDLYQNSSFISGLMNAVPLATNIRSYCDIVKKKQREPFPRKEVEGEDENSNEQTMEQERADIHRLLRPGVRGMKKSFAEYPGCLVAVGS